MLNYCPPRECHLQAASFLYPQGTQNAAAFWRGRKALMIKVGKSFLMEFQVGGATDYG